MDFRKRLLKENKQSSNSTVELHKHLDFQTPKSLEKQSTHKIRQLQSKLNNLAESQKVENGHNSQLFSKFGLSLSQLQSRIANIEKICLIASHTTLHEKQQITSLKPKESVSQQDTPKSRKNLLPQTKRAYTEQSCCFNNCLTNSKFNVPDSSYKGIESLKSQFQGKLKALADKIFLDFNIKSQFSTKQKQEQDHARFLQFQKKFFDANSKMKKNFQHQILRKVSKMVEDETQKMTKKIDVGISSAKKYILNDIEKDRCVFLEQINKVRVEMDGKVKARDERIQNNPKKQAENKMKQQEIKTKIDQIQKKMNEVNNKVKSEIFSQIDKHRIKNEESMIKLKGEWKLQLTDLKSLLQSNTRDTACQLFKLSSKLEELTKITKDKQASRQIEHLLKQQLMRQIQIISDRLNIMHKSLQQKINAQTIEWKQTQSSISYQMCATNELVNKLQSRIFAENQQNKSVYHKMSSDLLQMTDSITLILTEMKPYRQ